MGYQAASTYAELIAPRYAPIADALVEAAALGARDDVLELGAGTGLVTARAAPRLRPRHPRSARSRGAISSA